MAEEVSCVSHWRFEEPSWKIRDATYFVDPPYLYNYRYRFKKDNFDYRELAKRVVSLPENTQAIVCEAVCPKTKRVPDYLPFEFFDDRITSRRKASQSHHSKELIYQQVDMISPTGAE